MIRNIVSKFAQWLSKKQLAALTAAARRRHLFDASEESRFLNRSMRRRGRAQRRRGRGVSGDKLARKAQQHKLCGRYSRLARRFEIIELRKKMGLPVGGGV